MKSRRTLSMGVVALLLSTGGLAAASPVAAATEPIDYTKYVDPFIGTGDTELLTGHSPGSGTVGQGTPAARLPFGMIQWGPGTDSVNNNARHYNYADSKIEAPWV